MRLGMKHVLVSFCLTLAAVFAPTTPNLNPVDVAMRTANCIPSTEIVVATTDWHEVHAVVVDMPQRASLEYASPESGVLYRRSIHRTRNLQQNRFCR